MLRYYSPFYGTRYLADKNTKVIHDLENESSMCYIDDINENDINMIDNAEDVRMLCSDEDYNGCHWCNAPFDSELFIY